MAAAAAAEAEGLVRQLRMTGRPEAPHMVRLPRVPGVRAVPGVQAWPEMRARSAGAPDAAVAVAVA